MGQRWVDIGGFSIVRPRGKVCWDSITQSQAHVQYSHFLRQADDVGGKGALKALRAVRLRFKLAFLAAATAKATPIDFWDGGAASVRRTALRPFFLLGRAAHLLQDSFSTEHGIRDASDGFRTVLGIKSYLCTQDSAQHTHRPPVKNDHGDVIWLDPSAMDVATDFGAGNVKPEAAAARDAMRDMWAGFLRARSVKSSGRSKAAQREADAIIKKWFSFDDAAVLANGGAEQNGGTVEQAFSGAERDQCLSGIAPAEEVETARKDCVRRVGGGTLGGANGFDDDLQIPFDWAIPIREGLKEDAKELGKGIKGAAGKAGGKAKAALEGAGKKVKGALESAGNSIKGAFGKVKGLFGGGGRMRW
ncbi:hypothetical protein DFJ74DRAFT_697090 [Hyaloraphidium curvatum]|nr:hypothetical protein DFJ74DRAFT_697090 [Hyaloraphidium curvatum]